MEYDPLIQKIADYVLNPPKFSKLAIQTAQACLLDAMGCAMLALQFDAAKRLIGPIVPGADCVPGARVVGTEFELDPVKAAFDTGLLIRWLDYNDTWLAKEWGHPSDNLGAILSVCDYLSHADAKKLTLNDILTAMIKAYEIQGVLALDNAFNRRGLDHVILVKLASAAVSMQLLGGDRDAIMRVISQVFVDGQSLRTYRHAPNTGSRKSWAAGDACARAVNLCLMTQKGEMGYPNALTTRVWGFQDVSMGGDPVVNDHDFSCYVMENILFKVAFPAEFHAQTAVEAAIALHPLVKDRLGNIQSITIETQEAGKRIIDKTGPLKNPADRDHCIQYMVAIALIFGELRAEHYEDDIAADPRVDALRSLMLVTENSQFTDAYFDPEQRAIPNSLQITFKDGKTTERVQVDFPLGHKRRRVEAEKHLHAKALHNLSVTLGKKRGEKILAQLSSPDAITMPVADFTALFI